MTDQLHDALARSTSRIAPSPAPVAEILHAGRARRTRSRRVRIGAVACLTSAVLLLSWTAVRDGGSRRQQVPVLAAPSVAPTRVPTAAPKSTAPRSAPQSVPLGHGTLDGHIWSAELVYYPVTPPSYAVGDTSEGLVCLAVTVDGKPSAPYGVQCDSATGPHDTSPNLGGVGQSNFPGGFKLVYGTPVANVSSATMTFDSASPVTVPKVTIPGTDFSAYVIAVGAGVHAKTLTEYDSHHRVVDHPNF